jgi:PAS domain S-box-containing protein
MAVLRAFITVSASRNVAALLLALSTIALVGWGTGSAVLIQPLTVFPPLRLGSACGLFVLGLGLLTSTTPRLRLVSYVCACCAIMIGSMPLQQWWGVDVLAAPIAAVPSPTHVEWHGELPGTIALSSAVLVTLGGIGLLALLSRPRRLFSAITLAATGGIAMVLVTTVLAAQLMGFLEDVRYGALLGSSLQTSICAIVFATHYNALAWSKEAGFSTPPAWLPVSVGAGSLVAVLFVWRALVMHDQQQLAERTRVAALASKSAATRQLMVAQRNLRRLVRFSTAPDARWAGAATQMAEDVAGIDGLLWADAAGRPRTPVSYTHGLNLALVERTIRPHADALLRPGLEARFLTLIGDSTRSLMVIPRCEGASCQEMFIAVLHAPKVLGAILADTLLGFDLAIGAHGTWYRASAPVPVGTRSSMVVLPIIANGPAWQLAAWPSRRNAVLAPSSLSDMILLLGIAVSVLLAIALRLAQAASQHARQEERSTVDRALQSTTDGLWEWDLNSGVVTRSPMLWQRLGYGDGNEYREMDRWLTLIHPDDRPRVRDKLRDHLAARSESFDAQYRVMSAAGRWHDFVDRGRVTLRDAAGQPLRLLGMFADTTDRRNAEETLRQAETMSTMGRLAARIAHEINNPLAGIQSAFLLIKDAVPPTHPHAKYVGAIEREVERISQVTRQLYETYRPETEASAQAPVQTVVGDAVAFLEQVNKNTGVTIEVEMGGIAAVVKISDSILRQCVYNLVQNAIEASPPGGRVAVAGAIEGDDFVLRVRDSGPGVPPELRERIFEPFVSTKPSQLSTGGMGLGLALVRRALNAAGGSIRVTDAPGRGAEFIARIPLVSRETEGAPV